MSNEKTIPPPPQKPDPNECCGSGCVPCIYDYYYTALEDWQEKYQVAFDEAAKEGASKEP